MALRTPLSVTPHLYMGDSTGRPLDMGTVYFGQQDKDPEFYPIDLFSDDALTLPLMQPVNTKGGYLYDKGDMVEPHAKELIYSVKVLDSYGRKVFYKGAMMRNSWNDDVIEQINAAIIGSADVARQVATDITNDAVKDVAIDANLLTDALLVTTPLSNAMGAVKRTQKAINAQTINLLDFYDRTDGDYTDAMFNAINSQPLLTGFQINIPAGRIKIKKTIFMTRRIELVGQGIGVTILDFSEATAGNVVNAPYSCGVIFVHPNNVAETPASPDYIRLPVGQVGTNGVNAKLTNLTLQGKGVSDPMDFNGVFCNAPTNLEKVECILFSGHGFVIGGSVSVAGWGGGHTYAGNANHTELSYCQAYLNGKNGLHVIGSDANSFYIRQCLFINNGGWGVFDNSLLGGVVIACESDGNGKGAYGGSGADGVAATPSRTLWLGNYAEEGTQPVMYAVNERNVIIGGTGGMPVGQNYIGGVVGTGLVSTKNFTVADNDNAAYEAGNTTATATRIGKGKITLRPAIGSPALEYGVVTSPVYIDTMLDYERVMRIPMVQLGGVLKKGIPYFESGLALGENCSLTSSKTKPTGAGITGQVVYNEAPVSGGYAMWVCTSSGNPAIWKGAGLIEA